VTYLCFSPDGKTLAVGSTDSKVTLLEWESGKQRSLPLPDRKANRFNANHGSFSPDGRWFVAGGGLADDLCVFEVSTCRKIHHFSCHASASKISPDHKRLAISSVQNDKGENETVIRLFDLTNGKETAQFPMGTEELYHSLAFSPDGQSLACSCSERSCVLDCGTGRVLYHLSGRPVSAAFSPNGKTLVTNIGHGIRVWDAVTGQERSDRPGDFGTWAPALAITPDGRRLAAADWTDRSVSIWDTTTSHLLQVLPLKGEQRYVRNLTISPNGQTLIASQYKGFIQSWDIATGKEVRTIQLHDPSRANQEHVYFFSLHVSLDGKAVSTLEQIFDNRNSTRLAHWDTASGKLISQHLLPPTARECGWSVDGRTVANFQRDGLSLMQVDTGAVVFNLPGSAADGPLAVSPDFRLLAARRVTVAGKSEATMKDESGTIGCWEAATGKEVATLTVGRIQNLALAPDNRSLVTTDERFLKVWDLATRKERCRWSLPEEGIDSSERTFVTRLVLAPDGRRAFTALADGTALVWDLTSTLIPVEPLAKGDLDKQMDMWWADLACEEPSQAYAAIWRLAELPEDRAIALLRKHLRPATNADFEKVRAQIQDLGSDKFAVRESASKQLINMGAAAVPALRQAIEKDPSPEVRRRLEALLARPTRRANSPNVLRRLRAIQVLEGIASKDARRLLTDLANGMAYTPEAEEAKASLQRLASRTDSSR
jgi:WD40 repeat protein